MSGPDGDVLAAAELIARDAAEQGAAGRIATLDSAMKINGALLSAAALAAQNALHDLRRAVQRYALVQDDAARQLAALGLGAGIRADDGREHRNGVEPDGAVTIAGTSWPARSPEETLHRTLMHVLNDPPQGMPPALSVHVREGGVPPAVFTDGQAV